MKTLCVIFIIFNLASLNCAIIPNDHEEKKMALIGDIIISNYNYKGWTTVITMGSFPSELYKSGQNVPVTFISANDDFPGYEINETSQYRANTAIVDCIDIEDFENKVNMLRLMPFWHPHSHTIIYYHGPLSKNLTAKMFFYMWYYMCTNVIIIQYNDQHEKLLITYYSPYIYENYTLDYNFGCWTAKKISYPIENFNNSFICNESCDNVTLPKFKTNHLGTCIGLRTYTVDYNDREYFRNVDLFEEKGKNLQGFPLRAFAVQIVPFLLVDVDSDGSFKIRERDGKIWDTMAQLLNFTIDFSPSKNFIKQPFNYEVVVRCIFDFSQRRADILVMPVYLFEFVVVDVDMSVPYQESGVCFVAHRAGFETTLFDYKFVNKDYKQILEGVFCFIGTWLVFFIFNVVEKGVVSFDQAGKDLVNAIRNMLSISLYRPPKKTSFRIFLLVSIWGFFIINFATQAVIISFFSAYKRGKDVETFEDIIEKGYDIEGVASPDVMLPETNEIFKKINSKIVPVKDLFECINKIGKDSRRFCINDCSVGRYLQRNVLNENGEQFLHLAKDQIHNHYLIMILQKYSPLTDHFNKYMLRIIQAGLINKWEEYRFHDMKEEVPVKSLSMTDLLGIFESYCFLLSMSCVVFVLELAIGNALKLKRFFLHTFSYLRWRNVRNVAKATRIKLQRKLGKIKKVDNFTQTPA